MPFQALKEMSEGERRQRRIHRKWRSQELFSDRTACYVLNRELDVVHDSSALWEMGNGAEIKFLDGLQRHILIARPLRLDVHWQEDFI